MIKNENGKIIIEKGGAAIGCVYVFLTILGLIMTAIGIGGVVMMIVEQNHSSIMAFLFILGMMGLLFFITGIYSKVSSFTSTVVLDPGTEYLQFWKEDKNKPLKVPLSWIDHISLKKIRKTRSTSTSSSSTTQSYWSYQIFAVFHDGAHFWLESFTAINKFIESVEELYKGIGIGIKDSTGEFGDREQTKTYTDWGKPQHGQPSRFLKQNSGFSESGEDETWKEGKTITLIRKKSGIRTIILFLVCLIFIGTPILMSIMSYETGGIGAFAFSIVFSAVFILLFIGIMILQGKRYHLTISGRSITVRIRFALGFLNKALGKTIEIPAGEIKQVRVNRLEEGHFWLSLVLSESSTSAPQGMKDILIVNAGSFAKSTARYPEDKARIISLWEIMGTERYENGPNYDDLYTIEKMIQDELLLGSNA